MRTDRTGARRMVRAPPAWDGGDRDAMSPVRVTGVAEEDGKRLPPRRERPVRERRRLPDAVDGLAGLAPVPFAGGGVEHDQGLGKAGSAMLRKHPVRMAWRWTGCQPESALSAWFRDCVSARDGRSRRRGTVALARRPPSCRRPRRGRATEDRTPGRPDGAFRGNRAGRVTDRVHGSPQDAAPSPGWVPPPGTWRRPNRASWSRGRHRPTEPDRRMDAPVGASWNRDVPPGQSPEARQPPPTEGGRDADVRSWKKVREEGRLTCKVP